MTINLKNSEWRQKIPTRQAPKHIPNNLATQYDGKLLVAITRNCDKTDRKNQLMITSSQIAHNRNSRSLVSSLKCKGPQCRSLELFKNLNSDFLSSSSAHTTDWFNENGYGKKTASRSVNCFDDCNILGFNCDRVCDTENYDTHIRNSKFGRTECPAGQFVNSIECFGTNCAFKRLHCKPVSSNVGIHSLSNKHIGDWVGTGSTTNANDCRDDYYLTGLDCDGDNCSKVRLICKKIQVRNKLCPCNMFDTTTPSPRFSIITHKTIMIIFN